MRRPIRALVVDDEPLGRERIVTLLAREPDIEIVGECEDGFQALTAIASEEPEVVFLDVKMPELSGVDVVDALPPEDRPEVIFVTAHNQYMERAFEIHALDYLRKPYTNSRFESALQHARRRVDARRQEFQIDQRLVALLERIRTPETERLMIRDSETGDFHVVETQEIIWVEAAGDSQVGIQLEREMHLWRKTLAEVEARLNPAMFLRVHRSYLVNAARITTVHPLTKGEYQLTLETGKKLRTGRSYRETVECFLER